MQEGGIVIGFHHQLSGFQFPEEEQARDWLQHCGSALGVREGQLSVIFCSDEYLLELNRSSLDHDYYTDILTFDLGDGTELDGELYISVERVADNAKELDQPFQRELRRVMAHGLLHLCGVKDESPEQKAEMRQAEDRLLALEANL